MPTHRHDMPNGMTFRNNSQRRYVVAIYNGHLAKWQAEYRTDVESRALASWRASTRRNATAALVDNRTGEVIR